MASGAPDVAGHPIRRRRPAVGGGVCLALAWLLMSAVPQSATAQMSTSQAPMAQTTTSAGELLDGITHLMGAGGFLPAQPGTAGLRVPGSPRWTVDLGVAGTSFSFTDVSDTPRRVRSTVVAPKVSVAAGLFEGFAPAPTVAGIGAVDLVVEGRLLSVPHASGVESRTAGWGLGARVGLLRESFTLPSVTLTGGVRGAGTLRHGSIDGEGTRVSVTPRSASIRATAGKDLLSVGISGGVERSWNRGRATARDPAAGSPGDGARVVRLRDHPDRTTWFVGLNRTWVVARVAAEVGWSPSPGMIPQGTEQGGDGHEAGSMLSLGLGFRITY